MIHLRILLVACALTPVSAQTSSCSYTWTPGCTANHSGRLDINFGDIAWRVCLEQRGMKGVWINSAEVRRPGSLTYVRVIDGAGPAEIFVPYNAGPFWDRASPPRYYDTQFGSWASVDPVSAVDLPAVGLSGLHVFSGDSVPKLVVECRDLGPSWLDKSPGNYPDRSRRALELVAWSVYDAGNYDYIVQYGFRNDGTITLRMGATGFNSPLDPRQGHMHNVLWHVHFNLMGNNSDEIELGFHAESAGPGATDFRFSWRSEGFLDLSTYAQYFPTVSIEDHSVTNYHGNHPGYTVTPFPNHGVSRHNGVNEQWTTMGDIGFAQWRTTELGWQNAWARPESYVLGSRPGETVLDPIVWCKTAVYHNPHDEDRARGDLPSGTTGITNMHWTGLDLAPHNFFEHNPVGGNASLAYAPLPANCLAWWRFDETSLSGSQLQVRDSISGVFGNAVGGASLGAGRHAGGLVLDGANDWVAPVTSASYLDVSTGDVSIEALFKPGTNQLGIQTIIEKRVESVAGYTVFLLNGRPAIQISGGSTWWNYVATPVLAPGQWSHLVFVVDRTAATPQVRIYVNGTLANAFTLSPAAQAANMTNGAVARIAQHTSGGSFLSGWLDELLVYRRALTAAEVRNGIDGRSGGR